MESEDWSREQKTLVNELIQGMELAKQLKLVLNETSSIEIRDVLVQRILCSFEKALLILNWSGSTGQPQDVRIANGVPELSMSMNASPRSDDFDGVLKDNQAIYDLSKKRKTMQRGTERVRVSPENEIEGPNDDGYSWRKYGQKDILAAKYPRSYYRCTYKKTQNCYARKQVQRSDEDPMIFEITYQGVHTCANGQQLAPSPASPEKQEQKQSNSDKICQLQKPEERFFNIQKDFKVNGEDLNDTEKVSPFSFTSAYGCINSGESYYTPFLSPSTPEPNPNAVIPFEMNNFSRVQNFQYSESDFAEITSTSASNSPIPNLDYSLDQVEMEPNFPFDAPGFFSGLDFQ